MLAGWEWILLDHISVYICLLSRERGRERFVKLYVHAYVCMYVARDVEAHKKLSRPKDVKLTNFVATMNVFLLAASCCLKVSGSLPVSERIWESASVCKRLRESDFWECRRECHRREREINESPNHVTGPKWEICSCSGFSWANEFDNYGTWLQKPLIIFWRLPIFVSVTSFLQVNFWSYFYRIILFMCFSLVGLKL